MEDSMKDKVVLAVCAHPDDLEFSIAGSIAKWVKEGATAYYLILTDGSKGSENTSLTNKELQEIRQKEQLAAAQILGVKEVFFLNYVDGELTNSLEVRRDIVRIIRKVKPNIVASLDPTNVYDVNAGYLNHPDHRVAGQATLDAIFPFSRNSRTFPELLEEGLPMHKVEEVFLLNFGNINQYVDITDTIDLKLEALVQHKSQQDNSEEVKNFVKYFTSEMGKKINAQYAEGFLKLKISG